MRRDGVWQLWHPTVWKTAAPGMASVAAGRNGAWIVHEIEPSAAIACARSTGPSFFGDGQLGGVFHESW